MRFLAGWNAAKKLPGARKHRSSGLMQKFMKNGRKGRFLLGALALSSVFFAAGQCLTARTDAELKHLQGYWEGEGAGGKCSIAITGTSLLYRAGTNWFKTTFTLPESANPRQLHATITDSSPPTNSIGDVVFAIYKIENGTLTLATVESPDMPSPENLDNPLSRYVLKKVPSPAKPAEPSKGK